MKRLIAAAALLALAGTASAADAKGNYAVLGTGAFTCADFLSGPPEVAQVVAIFVHGYATALNQAMSDVKDVTAGRTDAQLTDALYNECNGRPDVILADATRDMIVKIGAVKAAPKKAKKAKAEAPPPADDGIPELRK